MERIFTEDVRKANGDVKFRAGSMRSYPMDLWRDLAKQIGKPLDEFSAEPKSFAKAVEERVAATTSAAPSTDAAPPAVPRPRPRNKE